MNSSDEVPKPYFKGHGYIDRVEKNLLEGWACDLNHLNASIVLEVRTSSGKSILALADIYRKDIHDASFGNGRHAFSIDVSTLDIQNDKVIIYYMDDGTPLNNIALDFDPERSLLDGTLDPRVSSNISLLIAKTKQKFTNLLKDGFISL